MENNNVEQAAGNQPPPPTQQLAAPAAHVRIPDFWVNNPNIWFLTIEATFEACRVNSSRARYNHAMPKLPEEVAVSISDLLENSVNLADPYEQLKARIIAAYGVSKYQRANDLLDMPALGDTKPSILMAKMLAIRPPDNVLFEACFLRRLPVTMREHLGARDLDTPVALAKAADILWEARGGAKGNLVAAVRHRSASPSPSRSRTANAGATPKPKGKGKGKSHGSGPKPPNFAGSGMCFYHENFGHKANNCNAPCSYVKGN